MGRARRTAEGRAKALIDQGANAGRAKPLISCRNQNRLLSFSYDLKAPRRRPLAPLARVGEKGKETGEEAVWGTCSQPEREPENGEKFHFFSRNLLKNLNSEK